MSEESQLHESQNNYTESSNRIVDEDEGSFDYVDDSVGGQSYLDQSRAGTSDTHQDRFHSVNELSGYQNLEISNNIDEEVAPRNVNDLWRRPLIRLSAPSYINAQRYPRLRELIRDEEDIPDQLERNSLIHERSIQVSQEEGMEDEDDFSESVMDRIGHHPADDIPERILVTLGFT